MSSSKEVARRSRWPYISLIPLGFGAWAPIYAGSRVQRRSWIAWGALWTTLAVLGLVLAVITDGGAGGGLLSILGWAGGAATSFAIRDAYEDQAASALELAARRGRARLADRERALRLAASNPALAQEIGIGRPDRQGAADGGVIDINNASVTALLALPGVDGEIATRIIETREKIRGFSSLEDLGGTLDLDGHFVEQLRRQVVFLPRVQSA
jgi:DNA uptake protein ComE-like DNA-binding protein